MSTTFLVIFRGQNRSFQLKWACLMLYKVRSFCSHTRSFLSCNYFQYTVEGWLATFLKKLLQHHWDNVKGLNRFFFFSALTLSDKDKWVKRFWPCSVFNKLDETLINLPGQITNSFIKWQSRWAINYSYSSLAFRV